VVLSRLATELSQILNAERLYDSHMSDDRPPPPCPRCWKTDAEEQPRVEGATHRWFHCRSCGHVWHEPLRESR
jgi:transposase-like protein